MGNISQKHSRKEWKNYKIIQNAPTGNKKKYFS